MTSEPQVASVLQKNSEDVCDPRMHSSWAQGKAQSIPNLPCMKGQALGVSDTGLNPALPPGKGPEEVQTL